MRRIFTSLIQDKTWNKDTLIFSRLLNSVLDWRFDCFFFNRRGVLCSAKAWVDFVVVWSWWKIQVEDTALRLLPICYIVYTKSNPVNFASIKWTRSAVSAINLECIPSEFFVRRIQLPSARWFCLTDFIFLLHVTMEGLVRAVLLFYFIVDKKKQYRITVDLASGKWTRNSHSTKNN